LEAVRGILVKVEVRCSERTYYATAKTDNDKHFKATHSESNLKKNNSLSRTVHILRTQHKNFGVLVENEMAHLKQGKLLQLSITTIQRLMSQLHRVMIASWLRFVGT
jgi:hypothetical protein